jgi:hypothetical protein
MRQFIPRLYPFVFPPGLMLLLVVILMLSSTAVHAQSASATGRLEGTVTDSTGATVLGAGITVRNQNTGISATLQSSTEGDFTFLYLDPGTYEVSIQKAGFNKLVLKDVTLTVGTRAIVHPQLAVGRVDTTVSVSAVTSLVDTAESSLGTVVGEQSIESLPLNGRNFTDFALLTPGATTDGDFGMISFNGVAGNFNNYTVDGGNNNNAFFAQQIGRIIPFQFSEDVIREFQVTSTGFEAEFGHVRRTFSSTLLSELRFPDCRPPNDCEASPCLTAQSDRDPLRWCRIPMDFCMGIQPPAHGTGQSNGIFYSWNVSVRGSTRLTGECAASVLRHFTSKFSGGAPLI